MKSAAFYFILLHYHCRCTRAGFTTRSNRPIAFFIEHRSWFHIGGYLTCLRRSTSSVDVVVVVPAALQICVGLERTMHRFDGKKDIFSVLWSSSERCAPEDSCLSNELFASCYSDAVRVSLAREWLSSIAVASPLLDWKGALVCK